MAHFKALVLYLTEKIPYCQQHGFRRRHLGEDPFGQWPQRRCCPVQHGFFVFVGWNLPRVLQGIVPFEAAVLLQSIKKMSHILKQGK